MIMAVGRFDWLPSVVPTFAETDAVSPCVLTSPVRWWNGDKISYREAKRRILAAGGYVRRPIVRYGDWLVCRDSVDALSRPYWIERDRLHESDWEQHLVEKGWPHDELLAACAAIRQARRLLLESEA